jgi:NAD(P)-dependent dehydrogenase (short-subunit alcohol dehydrogenase family)
MALLEGRVAIVTGAGRGLGRSHALALAESGAAVVVNDIGADLGGGADGDSPADEVVAEIVAAGGRLTAEELTDGMAALYGTMPAGVTSLNG